MIGVDMTKITEHDAQTGITTSVHYLDGKTVIEKSYDAQPLIEVAASMRAATEGESWGEMRHVGFIPMAELGKMMRQDGGFDRSRMIAWLKANPMMATFSKVLK
jgi:hypothetical protein